MAVDGKYIAVTFAIEEEDGQFVGTCLQLGTSTCGDTLDKAFHNLKEAVELHLDTLEELGERQLFFREMGIKVREHPPKRRRPVERLVTPNAWV